MSTEHSNPGYKILYKVCLFISHLIKHICSQSRLNNNEPERDIQGEGRGKLRLNLLSILTHQSCNPNTPTRPNYIVEKHFLCSNTSTCFNTLTFLFHLPGVKILLLSLVPTRATRNTYSEESYKTCSTELKNQTSLECTLNTTVSLELLGPTELLSSLFNNQYPLYM